MTKGIRLAINTDVDRKDVANDQWTSEAVSPKFRLQDKTSVTTDGSGNATLVIPHGLGYSPVYLFYSYPTYTTSGDLETWGIVDNGSIGVDSGPQSMTLYFSGVTPNKTYKISYFIFVEPAANV